MRFESEGVRMAGRANKGAYSWPTPSAAATLRNGELFLARLVARSRRSGAFSNSGLDAIVMGRLRRAGARARP